MHTPELEEILNCSRGREDSITGPIRNQEFKDNANPLTFSIQVSFSDKLFNGVVHHNKVNRSDDLDNEGLFKRYIMVFILITPKLIIVL